MKLLVLNAGSSSLKYRLYAVAELQQLASGLIENIGAAASNHVLKLSAVERPWQSNSAINDHAEALAELFRALQGNHLIETESELAGIAHRVVHGGEFFQQPVRIDDDVIARISDTIALAPLHNPANLQGIEQCLKRFPQVPQIAVFDTAFHQTLPEKAYRYAVPSSWYGDYGVRRYGFHGSSHSYVAKQAAAYLQRPLTELNLISLHLGNGASACAIANGQSVDTSMGLTPLEGLIMGSRSGDIDPALIFYLQREAGLSPAEIETALNKHSGLRGICQQNDLRTIQAMAEQGDENAQLAIQMFCYRIKKYIGAYYAVLGSVDALIFTGGIGENAAAIRALCCEGLEALGIAVDAQQNLLRSDEILEVASSASNVSILVVHTDEEQEIAIQTLGCCGA